MVTEFYFENPLYLLSLPLPFISYWLLPTYKRTRPAIKAPFFSTVYEALKHDHSLDSPWLEGRVYKLLLFTVSWLMVVFSMAQPTVLSPPQVREQIGRDVLVVLDLSGSMAERDFLNDEGYRISRLNAAKNILNDFSHTRDGDRLGLILFGDAAYIQAPFTADLNVWRQLLQQSEVAMAGQGTHLGDAIGLAIKIFEHSEADCHREKVVVVLTDGNDTGSIVEPIEAAKVAAAKGVRIHMVAMGDPLTVGEAALDMEVILQTADISGGMAFHALDNQELSEVYHLISQLEPSLYESSEYQLRQPVHHYFMLISALALLL